MKNYYLIMDVSRTDTLDTIKKAYRTRAKQWHPDKNKNPLAEDMYKDLCEAYYVLSDDEKKKNYDMSLDYEKNGIHPPDDAPNNDGHSQKNEHFAYMDNILNIFHKKIFPVLLKDMLFDFVNFEKNIPVKIFTGAPSIFMGPPMVPFMQIPFPNMSLSGNTCSVISSSFMDTDGKMKTTQTIITDVNGKRQKQVKTINGDNITIQNYGVRNPKVDNNIAGYLQ